jgi:hypothetical protein
MKTASYRLLAWPAFLAASLVVVNTAHSAPPKNAEPAPDPSVEAAKAQEKAAFEEWNSLEMARSATREIVRSERRRAEEALQALLDAEQRLQKSIADQQPENGQAILRQTVQDRSKTVRSSAERMMAETLTANKASHTLYAAEDEMRDKMAATRTAELAGLNAKGAQAKSSAPDADATALSKQIAEAQTLREMEIQHWAAVRKDTARELIEQASDACRIARQIAKVETDADHRRRFEQFATEQAAETASAKQVCAEAERVIDAASARVYPLWAAAVGGLKPLPADQWDYAKARHLLVRAGFGGTPQEVKKLHALGLYKAVDHLVEFYRHPPASSSFDPTPLLVADPLEGQMRVTFLRGRIVGVDRRAVEVNQQTYLRRWWLERMVESPRPLQEKLTLFWHGHFASQQSVVQNSYTMFRQLQFFREHAAGNFGALLYSIVHDPAMIRYLDNNQNAKGKPNENLAREILELFSMGVDQGYTEQDIVEAARALTGYTFDNATGTFRFVSSRHDTGDKTIFGKTGPWTGDDLVRLILERPETARFISRKLFEYFAYTDPDDSTIDQLATVLRSRDYALEPMLKNLFLSEEFYSSRALGNQIKSPVELAVGLLRDLGAKPTAVPEPLDTPLPKRDGDDRERRMHPLNSYAALDIAIEQMGMRLLEPPDVKGWRYGRTWISSQRLFVRYNAVAELLTAIAGAEGEAGIDLVGPLLAAGCQSSGEAVDCLARTCLMRPLAADKRAELMSHLGDLPHCGEWVKRRGEVNSRLRAVLVLLLSMPEYQMA